MLIHRLVRVSVVYRIFCEVRISIRIRLISAFIVVLPGVDSLRDESRSVDYFFRDSVVFRTFSRH